MAPPSARPPLPSDQKDLGLLRPAAFRNPSPDPTAQLIRLYLNQFPGDAESAFRGAQTDRIAGDTFRQARPHTPEELQLRDAEHALYMNYQMRENPWLGLLSSLLLVPGYSAVKAGQQALPRSLGLPFQGSSPPSLSELYWGLAPAYGLPPFSSGQGIGRGQDPNAP